MRPRQKIPAGLRFSVLERDHFACRYCGARAPDVKLVVDHVHPHSLRGPDVAENLVTACDVCNAGKADRVLDEAALVVALNEPAELVALVLSYAMRGHPNAVARLFSISQHPRALSDWTGEMWGLLGSLECGLFSTATGPRRVES